MANLSSPTFEVDILTGMPNDYRVIATVNVELTPFETMLVGLGLPLQVKSDIWGEDAGLNGTDELLFSFPTQSITAPGLHRFEANVSRGVLNEDRSLFDNKDELYNRFSMVSGSNLFPINVTPINSPDVIGVF